MFDVLTKPRYLADIAGLFSEPPSKVTALFPEFLPSKVASLFPEFPSKVALFPPEVFLLQLISKLHKQLSF